MTSNHTRPTTADDDRERNVRTVDAFYESERRRDLEAWTAFWTPDGRHTFPFDPSMEVSGLETLVATTARKFAERPPYEIRTVIEPFADPRRVLARLHLVSDAPGFREAHLWCIFHFDAQGKVTEIEEMLDTAE